MRKVLSAIVYAARWVLYPVNIALLLALAVYVGAILVNDARFIWHMTLEMETLMVGLLGFVDAAMVANLVIMVAQGSHQIFITKFELGDDRAQYLDHIDSTLLKVKTAMSIAGITLIQILKDFVSIEKIEWSIIQHRMVIHIVCLVSALILALIWRVTHPKEESHAPPTH